MRFPRWLALLLVFSASTVVSFPLGAWWGPWFGGIFSGLVCGVAVLAFQWGPAEFLGWVWLELWNLPSTLACLWWDYCTPTGRRVRRRARRGPYCKLCQDYGCDHPHTGRPYAVPVHDPIALLDQLVLTDDPDPAGYTGYQLLMLQRYTEGRATGQPEVHPSTDPTDTTKDA